MNSRSLVAAFARWRQAGKPLVLATVATTAGSTYTKTGAFMLLGDDGRFAGLLSGGCLEPDLAEHAARVRSTRIPETISYDMRDRDEDELWGLGLGCDGAMQILLQPLDEANGYEPFATLADAIESHSPGTLVLGCDAGARGAAAFVGATGSIDLGLGATVTAHATGIARVTRAPHRTLLEVDDLMHELLFVPAPLPARLLVLGAGPDVVPVMTFAHQLGWHVTIADHRAAHVERAEFAAADARHVVDPGAFDVETLSPAPYDAVVVMSHHLASDRAYLAALRDSATRYIGLLGPPARKQRLLEDLDAPASFASRVHGPAGIDIGARGPDAIALSIVAGIHEVLARGDG